MPDDKAAATAPVDSAEEVERIRDIIFGPQMRDYDQRFQTVLRDLDRLQEEIDQLTEQLSEQDRDKTKKLQTLRRDMRKADDDLRAELRQTAQALTNDKVDRLALGELFIQVGTHLKGGGSLNELLKGLVATE
jgi:DNA repair ATPase RecN